MYYCKTDKGYVTEELDNINKQNIKLLFSDDINKAKLFYEPEISPYFFELTNVNKEFIKVNIPDELKVFCMKDYLGNVQDKTTLDIFGRKVYKAFCIKAEWIENVVKVYLWEADFRDKFCRKTYGGWERLAKEFLDNFYIDVYKN